MQTSSNPESLPSSSQSTFTSFPIPDHAKINFAGWLTENQSQLTPPVSNKMLFDKGQFKVMVVGGPNQRTDYHYNTTEEFFYQMKGDMILKVVLNGNEFKDIPIKEGEMFVLPGRFFVVDLEGNIRIHLFSDDLTLDRWNSSQSSKI